ncbi:MAG: hypothetical protein HYX80_09000 [Chloroflexi bacterium]|nr:hypothetical protein [Chloroflexota bacterium]
MNFPPMVMRLKIKRQRRGVNLWLPLFIIVPITGTVVAALFIVLLPLLLIVAIIRWRLNWWRPFLVFPAVLTLLSASRGLEVDINQSQEKIYIAFK